MRLLNEDQCLDNLVLLLTNKVPESRREFLFC